MRACHFERTMNQSPGFKKYAKRLMGLCFSKIYLKNLRNGDYRKLGKYKNQKTLKNQGNIRNELIKIYHRFL